MAYTDWLYPGTAADGGGTHTWSDVNNIKLADNSYATCTVPSFMDTSSYLIATNFGVTTEMIGEEGYIDGIEIAFLTKDTGEISNDIMSNSLILNNTKISDWLSVGWPAVAAYTTLGGATNKLGATLSYADVMDATFGVRISVRNTSMGVSSTAYVDDIVIRLYYTENIPAENQTIALSGALSAPDTFVAPSYKYSGEFANPRIWGNKKTFNGGRINSVKKMVGQI